MLANFFLAILIGLMIVRDGGLAIRYRRPFRIMYLLFWTLLETSLLTGDSSLHPFIAATLLAAVIMKKREWASVLKRFGLPKKPGNPLRHPGPLGCRARRLSIPSAVAPRHARRAAPRSKCRPNCTWSLRSAATCSNFCMSRGPGGSGMAHFTAGELKVMRLLWEHGELKPAELQALFPGSIKNPAIRSYLTTLVEKGHATRRRVGRAYVYRAMTRSRSAFGSTLAELVDTYCGGSIQALVMNIIKAERLNEAEWLELKRLADAGRDAPPGAGGGRP